MTTTNTTVRGMSTPTVHGQSADSPRNVAVESREEERREEQALSLTHGNAPVTHANHPRTRERDTGMTTVPPSTEQAVEQAIRRIKAAWPAQRWSNDSEREYRSQLAWLRDPTAIQHATNTLIRATTDRFAPPIGLFIQAAQDDMARRDTARKHHPSDLRFLQAQPDPRDPPGTIRWIIVNRDGTRNPRNATAVDDIATRPTEPPTS